MLTAFLLGMVVVAPIAVIMGVRRNRALQQEIRSATVELVGRRVRHPALGGQRAGGGGRLGRGDRGRGVPHDRPALHGKAGGC